MSLALAFSRLSLFNVSKTVQRCPQLMQFHTTPIVCGEPLKKKKRLDPAIILARENRRKRKLEKQIRRLEKHARQLKPIEEAELPECLLLEDQRKTRIRKPIQHTDEELERRALLHKEWTRYKRREHLDLVQLYTRVVQAQERALNELRLESEELYQAAIQPDENLFPITIQGPVATPPIKGYAFPGWRIRRRKQKVGIDAH